MRQAHKESFREIELIITEDAQPISTLLYITGKLNNGSTITVSNIYINKKKIMELNLIQYTEKKTTELSH